MKKLLLIILICTMAAPFVCPNPPIFEEYDNLYNDLKNYRTIGYKGLDHKTGLISYDKQGFLLQTNSSLDIAIVENGYFKVKDNDGNFLYTRNGSFTFNKEGYITNSDGYLIQPEIKVELRNIKEIRVEKDHLIIDRVSESNLTEIQSKSFPISLFIPGKESLISYKNNYFIFSSEQQYPDVQLYGGYLEFSTVEIIPVLTKMLFLLAEIKEKPSLKKRFAGIDTKIVLLEKLLDLVLFKELKYEQTAIDSNEKEIEFLYNLTGIDPILPFLDRLYQ